MAETDTLSILHRLARKLGGPAAAASGRPDPAEPLAVPPPTPGRVMGHSVARASERALGHRFALVEMTEEVAAIDAALSQIPPDRMLVALQAGGQVRGLAAFDDEARAALVELQTLGRLRSSPAEPRAVTSTDAALSAGFLDTLLADIDRTSEGTSLAGWTTGYRAGRRLDSTQAATLVLPQGLYRGVVLTVELGTGDRLCAILLLLPDTAAAAEAETRDDDRGGWRAGLTGAVLSAPADLEAVLHRMKLPLAEVEGFEIGDVVPLPGVTVSSVRLEGPGGTLYAHARLGQVAGMRAVRIEEPVEPELRDAPLGRRAMTGSLALATGEAGDEASAAPPLAWR